MKKIFWNNRGMAIVYIAILLFVLLAFVGLVVDIGYMYVVKGQLQNAADAAALAGAGRLRGANIVTFDNHSGARREAWRFACKNRAAGSNVFVVESGATDCGSPPADLNNSNVATGDIVLGYWNGSTFLEATVGSALAPPALVNAVKVVARRTAGSPLGAVEVFFGQIFRMINSNWSQMNARSEAIAILKPTDITPIVVNEYWLAKDTEQSQRPYDDDVHRYPNSFVRATPVGPISGTVSAFGKTFAILGAGADTSMPAACGAGTGANVNGYVNLDFRNPDYAVSNTNWYQLSTGAGATSDCTSGCIGGFTGPMNLSQGGVDSQKDGNSLTYLFNGYPSNYMLPTAIKERYINTVTGNPASKYPCDSNQIYPPPAGSVCPYATVAYFTSSGKAPLNKNSPVNGSSFEDNFKIGRKIIALVYDGTYRLAASSGANGTTIVGYTLLQIDGYSSNTKGVPGNLTASGGNTLYAHAISDIVEPSTFGVGGCDTSFFQSIEELRVRGGNPVLVR